MSNPEYQNGDLFETLDADEWKVQGGAGSTERGLYATVLGSFVESGARYAVISMTKGRFAGKKSSSVATALKATRDGKNPPDGVGDHIKIRSRAESESKGTEGAVFLENTNVEA